MKKELLGMRVLKVGLSKAQWLKILYSKAYALAKYGDIQDNIQADYTAHREAILERYRDVIDKKHLERFNDSYYSNTKGFWGNFTHYMSRPPGENVKVDQSINLGEHVMYLQPSWYQKNPGLLSFMNLPTWTGEKIIDVDLHNTLEDLDNGNPIVGPELTTAYTKLYNRMVDSNMRNRLMPFSEVGEFYQIIKSCTNKISDYFHGGMVMWSGGGFQVLADWDKHKVKKMVVKDEKGEAKEIDAVDPVNASPQQFMRLLSPMLYKAHLTTSMPVRSFEEFRVANPAFYSLPLSSIGTNGKSALSKFEFSFKSDTMNRILEKSGLKNRYLARRAYQMRLAGQLGIKASYTANPLLIHSYEALEGISW